MKRLILAAALSAAVFSANALEITPLVKVHKTGDNTGVLTLRNTESTPKSYQIFVDEWDIVNGERVFKTMEEGATPDLRVVPSLITIPAGKRQIVRYQLTSDRPGEDAYRIRVEEILDPEIAKLPGLHRTLEVEFPWFWRAATETPQLSARWESGTLVIQNNGTGSAQLTKFTAGTIVHESLGFVRPGEIRRIDLNSTSRPAKVSVVVNGKTMDLDVQ